MTSAFFLSKLWQQWIWKGELCTHWVLFTPKHCKSVDGMWGFQCNWKRRKGVFTALTYTAALLLASLINLFLNSGTTQQGHVIKGNISSFIICMCVYINICVYVCMYICLLDELQALCEISWIADRSIQISAVLWPLVRQNSVSLVVWTKQGCFWWQRVSFHGWYLHLDFLQENSSQIFFLSASRIRAVRKKKKVFFEWWWSISETSHILLEILERL